MAELSRQTREALTEPLCDATFRARLLRQDLSTDEMADYVAVVEKERREAAEALDALAARVDALQEALRDYDTLVEQAIGELVERGDKDFFWRERVADARTVMKALRADHSAVLASVVPADGENDG